QRSSPSGSTLARSFATVSDSQRHTASLKRVTPSLARTTPSLASARALARARRRRGRRGAADLRDELLRRLRAVALVDPRAQHRLVGLLARLEAQAHPAALAEAVRRRLRVRDRQRDRVRVGQLAGHVERLALEAEVRERLVLHGEIEVP